MEGNAIPPRDSPDLRHWLDRADLVVCMHHTDQHGRGPNSRFDRGRIHATVGTDRHGGGLDAEACEPLGCMQYRMMFNTRGDDMITAFARGPHHSLDRCVV